MKLRPPAPIVTAGVFACVCALVVWLGPHTLWSPDSDAKLVQMLSLGWDHGLTARVPYPGQAIDPHFQFVPLGRSYYDVREDGIAMAWPVLFALITRPFYALFGFFGLFVVPIASGTAVVVLTGKLAERVRPGTGPWASLLVATTTPIFIYSVLFWEHTAAVALGLVATLALFEFFERGRPIWAIAAASSMAFAAFSIRGDAFPFGAALFGTAFVLLPRGRAAFALFTVGGGILGALPGVLLNSLSSGTSLPPNALKNVPPLSLDYVRSAGLWLLPHFFVGNNVFHVLGAAFSIFAVVAIAAHRLAKKAVLAIALALLALSSVLVAVEAAFGHFFHGWLSISPVLVLGFMAPAGRVAKVLVVTALVYCAILIGALGLAFPNGFASDLNLEWGPRYWLYLFPMMACLAVASSSLDGLGGATRRVAVGAIAVLLGAGASLELIGWAHIQNTLAKKSIQDQALREIVASNRGSPIVFDTWWLAQSLPDAVVRDRLFLVEDPGRVDAWANAPPEAFTLVSFGQANGQPLLRDPAKIRAVAETKHGPLYAIRCERVRSGLP